MRRISTTPRSPRPTPASPIDRGRCDGGLAVAPLPAWLQALAAAWVLSATAAAAAAERIGERDYGPLAVRAESALRRQIDAPLRTEFHRRQAFRLGPDASVLSMAWLPEGGGEPHCTLAIVQVRTAQTFDALDGQADAPPWGCDGEPAIRLSDFDADGCVDVLALFPM